MSDTSLGERRHLPVASPEAAGILNSHHYLTLLILFIPYQMSVCEERLRRFWLRAVFNVPEINK